MLLKVADSCSQHGHWKKMTTLIHAVSNLCTTAKTLCAALQKSSSPWTSTELWSFSSLWTLAISCSFFSCSFSLWRREQRVLNNNTSYDSAFWKWHGSVHLNNRNHNHQKHWLKTIGALVKKKSRHDKVIGEDTRTHMTRQLQRKKSFDNIVCPINTKYTCVRWINLWMQRKFFLK